MNVSPYAAPTLEPVSVGDLRTHLKIDGNDQDGELASMITTAREQVEAITRRALMTQTWDYFLDGFPSQNFIVLPFGKLASVTSVKYKDSAGTETTMMATTDYLVETNGEGFGRIVLPYGVTWPSVVLYPSNPVSIRFVAGWTSAALVPYPIKAAIKMICADFNEARGEDVVGTIVAEQGKKTVANLLASYRLWGNF